MSYNPTSPLPGATQTGFTSPTYTLSSDIAPENNAVQHAVTALGGTQPGTVDAHSVSRPFTLTAIRPKVFKYLGIPNPVTGLIGQVPYNRWKFLTRKGVLPLSGQPNKIAQIYTVVEIPAGVDTADADNIRAALSAHVGLLTDQSTGIGDSLVTGIL